MQGGRAAVNITRLDMFGVSLHSVCMNVCLLGGVCSVEAALLGDIYVPFKRTLVNHSVTITFLATHRAACCCHGARLSPPTGRVAVFSLMPALLFAEPLPRRGVSREPKYVCVCARNMHLGERLPSDRLAHVCVCGCLCGMEALVGCVAQTGQSGGRLVSGPHSHYQAGCII